MNKSLLFELFHVIGHYKKRLLLACVLVLASNTLLILNPLLIKQAMIAMDPSSGKPGGLLYTITRSLLGSYAQYLLPWTTLLLLTASVSAYFKYKMRTSFITVSRDVESELQLRIFQKISRQSMVFFDKYGIGELVSRLTNDLSAYREVLGPGIMYPLYFLTLVSPAFIALFYLSPLLASFSLLPLLILPLLMFSVEGRAYNVSLKVQQALAEMSALTHESYNGIRIIKGYAVEEQMTQKFSKACKVFLRLNLHLTLLQGLLYPLLTLITKCMTLSLVLLAAYLNLLGYQQLETADFISFMLIQSYLYIPVLMLGWVLPIYEKGRAAYERLWQIYQEPIEIVEAENPLQNLSEPAAIEIKHLSFTYKGRDAPALLNFSCRIPAKRLIGITGPVGSGKTTLIKLLNRDYEVPQGTVFFNGEDLHNYSVDAIRKAMATVEQQPFLFSRSIAENIALGVINPPSELVEEAAEFADLHSTIVAFPMQYETVVGEKGITLSGGQRQRTAIARALFSQRPILLLDDIFSSLDAETEKKVFSALNNNRTKTIILITHRTSILQQLDYVYYLKEGGILEEGTPQELLAMKGAYSALVSIQEAENNK